MPLFEYKAYDKEGKEVSGFVDAPDAAGAKSRLREQSLISFELDESGAGVSGARAGYTFSLADQSRFCRQLGTLLKGGVPLAKALLGMESQEGWAHRRLLLVAIREEIERGRDLSVVLTDRQGVFDAWSLSVIKVGEATGRLDSAFQELSHHLTRKMENRRKLLAAITYPIIMGIVALGVLSFLMVYLIPIVQQIFADMHGSLPLITRVLISTSAFLRQYGILCAAAIILIPVLIRFAFAENLLRRHVESILVRIPILGAFLNAMRIEGWTRNTAMMIRSGVPLLDAIKVGRACSGSVIERDALEIVENGLVKGEPLSTALKRAGGFPALLIQMTEAGESSGNLAEMLNEVASELEAESSTKMELMLNLLEPLLIVAMGVIVGGIMVGVLLPIYEMNKLLR